MARQDAASFDGKVVVITGGAGGIGAATARAFTASGARVALLDKVAADAVAGATGLALCLDLTKEDEVARAIAQIVELFGKIDVLFNNCGVGANLDAEAGRPIVMRGSRDADETDFDFVIDTNLKSALWATKHAVPRMPPQEGSCIVTSSSIWSNGRHVGAAAYTAGKAALSSLALNWAYEFAPIRSVALVLGAIDTPMCRLNPQSAEEIEQRTLVRRMGTPAEVAEAVLFVAGCRFVNATQIVVDGGNRT